LRRIWRRGEQRRVSHRGRKRRRQRGRQEEVGREAGLNHQINGIRKDGVFDGITEFSELTEFWEEEFLTGRHEIHGGKAGEF
jgi:hypothetical protein